MSHITDPRFNNLPITDTSSIEEPLIVHNDDDVSSKKLLVLEENAVISPSQTKRQVLFSSIFSFVCALLSFFI